MRLHRVVTGVLVVAGIACGLVFAQPEPGATDIAKEIVRNQLSPAMMEEVYVQASQAASTQFQLAIQPAIKRAVTRDEQQRLLLFWHDKVKDLFPYSAIEDVIVSVVTKNVSLEDLQEIKRFSDSPAGRRYAEVQAVIVREARAAGEQLGAKLADKEWQARVAEELKREFPQWFPAASSDE